MKDKLKKLQLAQLKKNTHACYQFIVKASILNDGKLFNADEMLEFTMFDSTLFKMTYAEILKEAKKL